MFQVPTTVYSSIEAPIREVFQLCVYKVCGVWVAGQVVIDVEILSQAGETPRVYTYQHNRHHYNTHLGKGNKLYNSWNVNIKEYINRLDGSKTTMNNQYYLP